MDCCASSLRLQHGAGAKLTFTPGRGFSFADMTPLLRIWQGEGNADSPLLTVGLTETPKGSRFAIADGSLLLELTDDDVADLPAADDLFFDITLADVSGFVSPFVGGACVVDADGSRGPSPASGSVTVALNGLQVPVVIQGGSLGPAMSTAMADLNLAVSEAETAANAAEAAKNATISALGTKLDRSADLSDLSDKEAAPGNLLVRGVGTDAQVRTLAELRRDAVPLFDYIPPALQLAILANFSTTDVSAYILKAATAANGRTLDFPGGTCVVESPVALAGLSLRIRGNGSTVKCGATQIKSYFDVSSASGVIIEGFTFDQRKADMPAITSSDYASCPFKVPVYANGSSANITVRDCAFTDLYTTAIYFYNSVGLTVDNCRFLSGVQTQDQWMQHIHLQTCTDVWIGNKCQFVNATPISRATVPAGIYASGVRRITIRDSYFKHCGRDNTGSHRVGAIDFYGDVTDVVLDNCVVEDCWAVAVRLNACWGGRITNCRFHINAGAEPSGNALEVSGSVIFAGNKGTRNVVVTDNTFEDAAGVHAVTVLVSSYDWGAPARNVTISGNDFTGCTNLVRSLGPFDGLKIKDNSGKDGRSAIVILPGTGLTSDEGAEANSTYRRLTIEGNEQQDSTTDDANAILIALANATSALVDEIAVDRNKVRAVEGSAAPAVVLQLNTSNRPATRSRAQGNIVEGYATAFQTAQHGRCDVLDNHASGTTTFLVSSDMENAPRSRGNFNNGTAVAETALAT